MGCILQSLYKVYSGGRLYLVRSQGISWFQNNSSIYLSLSDFFQQEIIVPARQNRHVATWFAHGVAALYKYLYHTIPYHTIHFELSEWIVASVCKISTCGFFGRIRNLMKKI